MRHALTGLVIRPEGPGLQETKRKVRDCKVRDYREFCAIPDLIRDH
jgi:hypothetical protein